MTWTPTLQQPTIRLRASGSSRATAEPQGAEQPWQASHTSCSSLTHPSSALRRVASAIVQAGEGLREFALKTSHSTKTLGAKAGESLARAGDMSSKICASPAGRRTRAEPGVGLPPKLEEDADDDADDGDEKARWNEPIVAV